MSTRQFGISLDHWACVHLKIQRSRSPAFQRRRASSVLYIEVLALVIHFDMPVHEELLSLRPAAASAVERVTRRRIQRQSKQVLGLNEVRHKAVADEEVDETEKIGGEREEEDYVEDALPPLRASRCIVPSSKRGPEALVLRFAQGGDRGRIIPEVDKRRVEGAQEQRTA